MFDKFNMATQPVEIVGIGQRNVYCASIFLKLDERGHNGVTFFDRAGSATPI